MVWPEADGKDFVDGRDRKGVYVIGPWAFRTSLPKRCTARPDLVQTSDGHRTCSELDKLDHPGPRTSVEGEADLAGGAAVGELVRRGGLGQREGVGDDAVGVQAPPVEVG